MWPLYLVVCLVTYVTVLSLLLEFVMAVALQVVPRQAIRDIPCVFVSITGDKTQLVPRSTPVTASFTCSAQPALGSLTTFSSRYAQRMRQEVATSSLSHLY